MKSLYKVSYKAIYEIGAVASVQAGVDILGVAEND